MSGIQIILICLGIIGMMPLAMILYGRHRTKKILTTGQRAIARIYLINSNPRLGDFVRFTFYNELKQQYNGAIYCRPGLYKLNQEIEIYYLQNNPKRNTVPGGWKSPFILLFGILLALFAWFAVYKLNAMISSGSL